MATYIVMLGPPGSGKGTQAKLIGERFGLPQISTGELFRAMKTQETPLARKVQEIMARGGLVSDEITIEIVKDRLGKDDCRAGAILDGFPRTTVQADALATMLRESFQSQVALVPLLEVSKGEIVSRLLRRAEQEGRKDDSPDVVQKRYEVYEQSTSPLVDYYSGRGLLVRINGDRPMSEVTADLVAAISDKVSLDRTDR